MIAVLLILSFSVVQEGIYSEGYIPSMPVLPMHVRCENYACRADGGGITVTWVEGDNGVYSGLVTSVQVPIKSEVFLKAQEDIRKERARKMESTKGLKHQKSKSTSARVSSDKLSGGSVDTGYGTSDEFSQSKSIGISQSQSKTKSSSGGKSIQEDYILRFVIWLSKKLDIPVDSEVKQTIEAAKYIMWLYHTDPAKLHQYLREFFLSM